MVPEKIPRVRVRQQELGWFVNLPVGWSQSRVDLVANCRGRAMARKRGYRPPQPSWSLAAGVWRLPGVVAAQCCCAWRSANDTDNWKNWPEDQKRHLSRVPTCRRL